MKAKKLALWITLTGVIALATLWLTATLAPTVIMQTALERMSTLFGVATNTISHSAPVTADARTVVRPSPDLAYSVCVYDLSESPVLRVALPKSADYLSVALYDAHTNNFFHLNDAQLTTQQATIRLYSPSALIPEGIETSVDDYALNTPTTRGLVLFRAVVRDTDDWERITQERAALQCVVEQRH